MSIEIITPAEEEDAFGKRLMDLLSAHAEESGHPFDFSPFLLEISDGGRFVGGLHGNRLYGWLFIRFIAIDPALRGQGWGRKLVEAAEDKARAEGLKGLFLDSYGFQAPKFYEKLGFTTWLRIGEDGQKTTRHYLAKPLTEDAIVGL